LLIQRPESEAKIAAMFDRVAPKYDFLNRLLSARQDQRWRKRLASMIPFRPNGRYLDCATGTGDVLLTVAGVHPEYGELVGTDISGEMLALAKSKVAASGLKQPVQLQLMSAESLDLPDSKFDSVSISFGLRNVVKRDQALREFHRVLVPGGVLLILEFFIPKRGLMAALFQFYFHTILPFIGGIFSDREAYKYLPQSVGSFYSPDELRQALYETGFNVEGGESYLFGACRLVRAVKR
jgi:demethylmenaquinone methyltransferase/2-methoxy-6-polyprenyl-1,4-benzoquinol methylase